MSSALHVSSFIVFFFKQKTAYELRISDWSSDVCSSDLRHPGARPDGGRQVGRGVGPVTVRATGGDVRELTSQMGTRVTGFGGDRKSVVEGKSVLVSVDLGGSRLIKIKIIKRHYTSRK